MLDAGVVLRPVSHGHVRFRTEVMTGDLGYKVEPHEQSIEVLTHVREAGVRLVHDNCVANTGSIIVTECDSAPETVGFAFGDSYSYSLLNFLAPAFRRLTLAHMPTM